MDSKQEIVDALRGRHDGMKAWLTAEAPYIFADQKHLDANTPERSYWHLGYLTALADVMSFLEQSPSPTPGNEDTSD